MRSRTQGHIPVLRRDGTRVAWTRVHPEDEILGIKQAWRLSSEGYVVRSEMQDGSKRTIYLHREVAGTPPGMLTDHINGDRLDNRRSNLRIATPSQNAANSADRRRRSAYRGVYHHTPTGRWIAQVSDAGRPRHLGIFDTPEEAAAAYDLAASARWGEYARPNLAG